EVNGGFFWPWRLLRQYPAFGVLTFFFFIALLRAYPVEDFTYLVSRLRIKVPFLLLPIAFLYLPRFTAEDIRRLLYFLLAILTLTSLGILINYLLDFEAINELLRQGHHIPTPRNHIRYSLFTAWAVIGGIYLWYHRFYVWRPGERWLIGGMTIFLFLFLHLLSVKSGLLVLYLCLGLGLLQYAWRRRAYMVALIGIGGLVLLPMLAYRMVPSFQSKIDYFIHDLTQWQKGEGAHYSDSGRLASLDAGWTIAREHWLWGVGTANMRPQVRAFYTEHYPDYPDPFMPQNQFLFAWASAGLLGLFGSLFAFFFPLLYRRNYRHALFLNFYLAIFVIIMIEHALENAVGVAHYLFFLLVFLSHLNTRGGRIACQPTKPTA
ncbi:MAG: O-antigen ligase family protein, partial [Lewinella sp.]|nr:O-antigen ligase family protein [Lewinella sp.]